MPRTVGAQRGRCVAVHSLGNGAGADQVEEPAFAVSFDDDPLDSFEFFDPLEVLDPESLPDVFELESLDDFDLAPSLPFWLTRLSLR